MSKFDEIAKMKKDFETRAREVGKEAVLEELKDFFTKYPDIKAVGWKQATPYFNDGEECIFSVHDVYCTSNQEDLEDLENANVWDWDSNPGTDELYTKFSSCEDLLKLAFGDHAQIIATPDEVMVSEYEHD